MAAWPARAQENSVAAAFGTLEAERTAGKGRYLDSLKGMAAAYDTTNGLLTLRGQPPLYCLPEKGRFDADLIAFIALGEYKDAQPVYDNSGLPPLEVMSVVLLKGLQSTFKCK